MPADHAPAKRKGAIPPSAPPPLEAPADCPPLWRSIAALADSLNAGSERRTFTEHAVRHYVRNAKTNGLNRYIRRLGSKILIDENGFRAWIDRQGQEAA